MDITFEMSLKIILCIFTCVFLFVTSAQLFISLLLVTKMFISRECIEKYKEERVSNFIAFNLFIVYTYLIIEYEVSHWQDFSFLHIIYFFAMSLFLFCTFNEFFDLRLMKLIETPTKDEKEVKE